MSRAETHSNELAGALSLVVARSSTMTPEQILAALDDIARKYVPKAPTKDVELETKRRVAEWKLKLLSERNVPLEQIAFLRDQIVALGHTNLETEGTVELYFAQYCARHSYIGEARHTLESLLAKLSDALTRNNLVGLHQLRKDAERILAKLET